MDDAGEVGELRVLGNCGCGKALSKFFEGKAMLRPQAQSPGLDDLDPYGCQCGETELIV